MKRGLGCLFKVALAALLLLAVVVVAVDHIFNLRSNVTYYAFATSREPLQIATAGGEWKPLTAMSPKEMGHAQVRMAAHGGCVWTRLAVRRAARTPLQEAAQAVLPAWVNVFEMQPGRFGFETSFKEGFARTTARETLEGGGYAFAITANFRDPEGRPLGLVVHEGRQRHGPFPAWTGYFFVKDGRPYFGPKSLFEETPGVLQEAAQGYPSVMKNHTVFSYMDLEPNKYFDGEKVTYRALAGVRQNGSIVFVLSGDGGVMNMAEVTEIAHRLNVQHATLLDGGRALQYSLRLGDTTYHFAAYNTQVDFEHKRLAPQRSPVFIGARPLIASPE